jgi:hypothetical protein
MKKSKSETARRSDNGRTSARAQPKRRTHFVPKVVFRTAVVGAVPVCVAASGSSCFHGDGGVASIAFTADADTTGHDAESINVDSGLSGPDGVALMAFSDASTTLDGGDAADGASDANEENEASFGDAGLDANAPDASDE